MKTFSIIMMAILSGILNGSYAVPDKLTQKWAWENTWLIFAVTGLFIVPWIIAFCFIPDVTGLICSSSVKTISAVFLFGLGWGIGSIAFVRSLNLIGFSLGYTIMMGLIAVIGAVIPLMVKNPRVFLTSGGMVIILSLLISIVGIILCGSAGKDREKLNKKSQNAKTNSKFKLGLILCFVSGVFSSMLNFSFESGIPLSEMVKEQLGAGTNAFKVNSIIWAIALTGGFISFLIYSLFLFRKNKTISFYIKKNTWFNFVIALFMGTIFYGSVLCYGWAASALGNAGSTVGWIIFTSGAIITANIWGLLSLEWKGVSQKALTKMALGSTLLIVAVVLVSYGNKLL